MDSTVKLLLESKSRLKLKGNEFDNTSGANDLVDKLEGILSYHLRSIAKDIEVEDANIKTSEDTITFTAQVYRTENGDKSRLESDENLKLQQVFSNAIKLPNPKKTGYDYRTEVSLAGTTFELMIVREKSSI